MARRALVMLAVGVLGSSALLMGGCGARMVLGPKPALVGGTPTRVELNSIQEPMVNACRAWLESLSAADAKKLEKQGRLVFSMDSLRKNDPQHAKLVEKYQQDTDAILARRMKAVALRMQVAGRRAPPQPQPGLSLQEVAFVKKGPGAFEIRFIVDKNRFIQLPLSLPLSTK